MKKYYQFKTFSFLVIVFMSSLFLGSCQNQVMDAGAGKETKGLMSKKPLKISAGTVVLHWDQVGQQIDGFGVAQAGWSDHLYRFKKRDEVMNWLFGKDGLRLSILRGEVFPHYSTKWGERNFATDENIDLPLSDPYFDKLSDDLLRRGQLWITREAKQKYHVDKLVFSTWSPPAYMKINGKPSGGSLLLWNYQSFADYLVDFIKAYQAYGLPVYAISPANEPEYAAGWNSCMWFPSYLSEGPFIKCDLAPALQKAGLNTKIICGENAQWSTYALIMGSELYVQAMLDLVPGFSNLNIIAAGHGYVNPITKGRIPITPFKRAESKGVKVWLTETSSIDNLDGGMQNGLDWAADFHRYLNGAHASAIIWWTGARPTTNNESLIVLNQDRTHYTFTKRYETFGNFSRYIKPGSFRIGVDRGNVLPDDMHITAYKDGNNYVIVTVNNTDKDVSTDVALTGANNTNLSTMKRVLTDEKHRWDESDVTAGPDGTFLLNVPAKSVVTFYGTIN